MNKRELLKNKVELECKQYCRKLQKTRNGTFKGNVEKMETYKALSRSVIHSCDGISEKGVEILLIVPNLLLYFYQNWVKDGKSMEQNILKAINRIITAYIQAENEEKRENDEAVSIDNRAS